MTSSNVGARREKLVASTVQLVVSDLKRSLEFYCAGLGFELIVRMDDMQRGYTEQLIGVKGLRVNVALIQVGAIAIELIEVLEPKGLLPIDGDSRSFGVPRVAFRVENVANAIIELRERGIAVTRVVATGEFWHPNVVSLRDPDGIPLSFQDGLPITQFARFYAD